MIPFLDFCFFVGLSKDLTTERTKFMENCFKKISVVMGFEQLIFNWKEIKVIFVTCILWNGVPIIS